MPATLTGPLHAAVANLAPAHAVVASGGAPARIRARMMSAHQLSDRRSPRAETFPGQFWPCASAVAEA